MSKSRRKKSCACSESLLLGPLGFFLPMPPIKNGNEFDFTRNGRIFLETQNKWFDKILITHLSDEYMFHLAKF